MVTIITLAIDAIDYFGGTNSIARYRLLTKIFATKNALVLMTCLSGVGYAEARAVHKHQTHPRIMQGHSVASKIQTPINSSKAIVRKQPVTAISATSMRASAFLHTIHVVAV